MTYYIPTKIHFGEGKVLNELESIVKSYNLKNIFLVSGRSFVRKTGLLDKILEKLNNYNIITYDKVSPSPKLEELDDALSKARKYNAELIIGFGGGSVLDTGKIVSVMMDKEESILDYIKKQNKRLHKTPFIAIPTTAGTGSEVSPFAAFYHDKRKQSFGSIRDYLVYPDYAIVDPVLTMTMPKELTASSGLDALSQALESYWNVNSNPLSDTHAVQAIKLILENLEYSYERINDEKSKFNVARASLEAGLAFSQTATTAPHSVSYPMTAHFNLSHGFACALTLPEFLLHNYEVNEKDCIDKRGHEFVKNRLENLASYHLGFTNIDHFYKTIKNLMRNINAPLTLWNAKIYNYNILIEEGFTPERMKNNPRLVTKEDLIEILGKIK